MNEHMPESMKATNIDCVTQHSAGDNVGIDSGRYVPPAGCLLKSTSSLAESRVCRYELEVQTSKSIFIRTFNLTSQPRKF